MAISFRQFVRGILLRGESSDPSNANVNGSIWHNSAAARIKAYVQGAIRVLVTEDQAQVLTNKSISGSSNTITNISPSSLSSNLNANQVGSGNISNAEYETLDGIDSNIQDQIDAIVSGTSTASNVGTGAEVFKQKVLNDLEFRTLVEGTNVTLTQNANDITIDVSVPSSGANVNLSNLAAPTSINQDLIPNSNGNVEIGSIGLRFGSIYSSTMNAMGLSGGGEFRILDMASNGYFSINGNTTSPSGIANSVVVRSGAATVGDLIITSITDSAANANQTRNLRLETGNKAAGTGNSGDIIIQPGTSSGGSRGKVYLKDGSEGTVGHVITSLDVNGKMGWAAPTVPAPNFAAATDSGNITNSTGTLVLVTNQSVSITTTGRPVALTVVSTLTSTTAGYIGNSGGGANQTTFQWRRNGSSISTFLLGSGTANNIRVPPGSLYFIDTSAPAGVNTYELYWGVVGTGEFKNCKMIAYEL